MVRPSPARSSLLALLFAAASCSAPAANPDDLALEDHPPEALTWVAPLAADRVEVGEPVDLVISTQNDGVRAMHFEVDGREVGFCDPTGEGTPSTRTDDLTPEEENAAPESDCRTDEDLWHWGATLTTPGAHTLTAWAVTLDGVRLEARREITVEAAITESAVDPSAEENDAEDPGPVGARDDEGVATVTDAIGERGYLDPNRGFHGIYGGREWRVAGQRVVFRSGELRGPVESVARCMARYGDSIRRYADRNDVSRASVVALALAETSCDDVAARPGRRGAGVMGLPGARCVQMNPDMGLSQRQCLQRMERVPDFAIQTAVRWLARPSVRRRHRNDPPLLAATYYAGALRQSRRTPWRVASPVGYIDRFVAAYNAYRSWERLGRPAPAPEPPERANYSVNAVFNTPSPTARRSWAIQREIVQMIDNVPRDGEVRVVMFSWSHPAVVDALIRAKDERNVRVHVVLDENGTGDIAHRETIPNDDTVRDSIAYRLRTAGFTQYVRCGRRQGLTVDSASSCVSNRPSAINHNKLFLFSSTVVDGRAVGPVVVVGSQNLTYTQNNLFNNAVVIAGDGPLYQGFVRHVANMAAEAHDNNYYGSPSGVVRSSAGAQTAAYFSPRADAQGGVEEDAGTDTIVERLARMQYEPGCVLRAAQMAFTNDRTSIAHQLRRIADAGCEVRLVYSNMADNNFELLRNRRNISLRRYDDNRCNIDDRHIGVHSKYFVFHGRYDGRADQHVVFTGSHNWTGSALRRNDETLIEIHDRRLARQFVDNHRLLWIRAQVSSHVPQSRCN